MEQFTNNGSTTLNGALDASQTNVVVTSATTFPTAGNFRIRVDDEIMLVTSVSGSTFTVTRAREGTTGASHSNGATVRLVLTAGVMTNAQVWDEIVTKSSDTGRSGTTPTDDDHLVSAISFNAGDLIEYEVVLVFDASSTTPDIKLTMASSVNMIGYLRFLGSDTTSNAILDTATRVSGATSVTGNVGSSNGRSIFKLSGLITFTDDSASFKLQWSTLNGGSTVTLKAGSFLRIRRLSNFP